jgi:hypothetical protein
MMPPSEAPTNCRQDRVQVGDVVEHRERAPLPGLPVPAQVERDAPVAGQRGNHLVPDRERHVDTVHEDDHGAVGRPAVAVGKPARRPIGEQDAGTVSGMRGHWPPMFPASCSEQWKWASSHPPSTRRQISVARAAVLIFRSSPKS